MDNADELTEEVIRIIEFEINQWFAGEGTLRECAERIYRLIGDKPIISAMNGDISCARPDIS